MWKLNEVVGIEYCGGHVYRVRFDDGLEGLVDFAEYVGRGPVFAPFADLAFFRQARVEGGTIAWPNGADIAPETLYEEVRSASAFDPAAERALKLTARAARKYRTAFHQLAK